MAKTHYFNPPPAQHVPDEAPSEVLRVEFAKRLQHFMAERGWNQSETARRASEHMPGRKSFGRDNISCYVRAVSVPRNEHLRALSKALGVQPSDLVPAPMAKSVESKAPALDLRDVGAGKVWLRINTEVPWDTAAEIMKLVKGVDGQSD
ncbi:MAG: hypothetical protein DI537_11390 [Stutzerimonas stutzeri]|nr:MAG: hypothetical protein DI537_11390 [Stutzerimonas stutzeri]